MLNYPFYPAYTYLWHKIEDFPVARRKHSRILWLSEYPEMTGEMVDYVAQ